jgi:hypothetical protein
MKGNLVILSFLLAFLISHIEEPQLPGGLNTDKFYKVSITESKYFFAENPDTDFIWYTAVTDTTGTNLTFNTASSTIESRKKSVLMHKILILHLDLPPPMSS